MHNQITLLLEAIAQNAIKNKYLIATAESCTGGWIAKSCTDIAGSSLWFDCGFVTYSNQAKSRMLGVKPQLIEENGAVSEQVVLAMCHGALENSDAHLVVAVSGIAGPGGGTLEKPVGLVWLGWKEKGCNAQAQAFHFEGDRESVRSQTVVTALEKINELLLLKTKKD